MNAGRHELVDGKHAIKTLTLTRFMFESLSHAWQWLRRQRYGRWRGRGPRGWRETSARLVARIHHRVNGLYAASDKG